MTYSTQELGNMTLQRLAYILPQNMEEETMVKEIFDTKASTSTYQTLTTIDVKLGWQETIIQKYVDIKRETMAPENPASLTPEEEGNLDTQFVTKEKELELQAILDKRNHRGLKEGAITDTEFTDTKIEMNEPSGTDYLPEMSGPTGTPTPEPIENITSTGQFCEFCDAKGPIKHKSNCTRIDNKQE